ncbi:MAG: tRNA (N6-threonylcarbamoyladenosine(37)-N6)-methyltransferase TrmO [Deltaproteobacteria bacterium]|nr:tRNA (N6-threonylcarbamoyladenosine(37)-N6)-methyltransferase TrmO [Deltaproteobacteria bacterium]
MKIEFSPIGSIHSPYTEPAGVPIQGVFANGAVGTVEVFPEFSQGLTDLGGFSHIILLYHLHRVQGYSFMCRPFLDMQDRGIFSTRAPRRPNPIGLSVVELLGIDGCTLTIGGVDIVDGTPLLDIKPYIPDFDVQPAVRIGWYARAGNKKQTVADDRFVHKKGKK